MASLKLTETTVLMINEYLQANLGTALQQVFADRNDGRVTLETPNDYFAYNPVHAYRRPAIITIAKEFNRRRAQKQPNYICALVPVAVECIVQDRDTESLMYKVWRYQCALEHLLDNAELTNADNSVKLVTKVTSAKFSGDYASEEKDRSDPITVFSKGVMIELDVEHYELKI